MEHRSAFLVPGLVSVLLLAACSANEPADAVEPANTSTTTTLPANTSTTLPANTSTTTTLPASTTIIQDTLEVHTAHGIVRGMEIGATRAFRGVPYAAAPTGANRWRSPQPVVPWGDVREAADYGLECFQVSTAKTEMSGGEDCLTLNVTTPLPAPDEPRPVMVWFHGGAFIFGSGGQPAYDGQPFVEATGVVVVTVNYRLGPLGFFAHPALTDEGGSSNFGIEDQQAALRWVRDNIGGFGGDPDNVTVFGESAGALSGCIHLVSPASEGLVDRVIAQSHPCVAPPQARPLNTAEALGVDSARRLGCEDAATAMACLRTKTPLELLGALGEGGYPGGLFYQGAKNWWLPVTVDKTVVPDQLDTMFANGDFTPVPVLLGTNTDEGTLFHSGIVGDTLLTNETELEQALTRAFGPKIDAILDMYPASDFGGVNDRLAAITTDAHYTCPAVRSATLLTEGGSDTYLYSFARSLEGISESLGLGATHAAEIGFVFGTDDAVGLGNIGADDWPLSEAMMRYWSQFAETGNPNGGDTVEWPAYTGANGLLLRLDLPITVAEPSRDGRCVLWDERSMGSG